MHKGSFTSPSPRQSVVNVRACIANIDATTRGAFQIVIVVRMKGSHFNIPASSRVPAFRTEHLSRSTLLRASLLFWFAPHTTLASGRPAAQYWPAVMATSVKLRTGAPIPAVGLGVFLAKTGKETYNAVFNSLKIGYRHIDTAIMYGNEADVGKAIKASGLPRDQVFVTSKLFDVDWGYDAATSAINKSLRSLDMQYIDLMLMHHPGSQQDRKETWQALENAHKKVTLTQRLLYFMLDVQPCSSCVLDD